MQQHVLVLLYIHMLAANRMCEEAPCRHGDPNTIVSTKKNAQNIISTLLHNWRQAYWRKLWNHHYSNIAINGGRRGVHTRCWGMASKNVSHWERPCSITVGSSHCINCTWTLAVEKTICCTQDKWCPWAFLRNNRTSTTCITVWTQNPKPASEPPQRKKEYKDYDFTYRKNQCGVVEEIKILYGNLITVDLWRKFSREIKSICYCWRNTWSGGWWMEAARRNPVSSARTAPTWSFSVVNAFANCKLKLQAHNRASLEKQQQQ